MTRRRTRSRCRYAFDGNPDTAWATETYFGKQWGGISTKTGVGLRVDLGKKVKLSQVRLLFTEAGASVELRYNDSDSASLDSYTVAASSTSTGKDQVLVPRTGAPPVLAHLADGAAGATRTAISRGARRDDFLRLTHARRARSFTARRAGNADLLRSVLERRAEQARRSPSPPDRQPPTVSETM